MYFNYRYFIELDQVSLGLNHCFLAPERVPPFLFPEKNATRANICAVAIFMRATIDQIKKKKKEKECSF